MCSGFLFDVLIVCSVGQLCIPVFADWMTVSNPVITVSL